MESRPQNPEFRNNPENFHAYVHNIFFILHMHANILCSFEKCCKLLHGQPACYVSKYFSSILIGQSHS